MASTQQPKTVTFNATPMKIVDPANGPSAAEISSSTIDPCADGSKGSVQGGKSHDLDQAAADKRKAEVKQTVDELIDSPRMANKPKDPSKPRRFVSV
ncbi:hypothetical protein R1sor_024303 [Riccia sorocarpa]|uniref:Uncharacterized protein n=1 Tax=Riccia sorocarpa TaxID=122646 RepID=A0ABD3GQ56_9MARC